MQKWRVRRGSHGTVTLITWDLEVCGLGIGQWKNLWRVPDGPNPIPERVVPASTALGMRRVAT